MIIIEVKRWLLRLHVSLILLTVFSVSIIYLRTMIATQNMRPVPLTYSQSRRKSDLRPDLRSFGGSTGTREVEMEWLTSGSHIPFLLPKTSVTLGKRTYQDHYRSCFSFRDSCVSWTGVGLHTNFCIWFTPEVTSTPVSRGGLGSGLSFVLTFRHPRPPTKQERLTKRTELQNGLRPERGSIGRWVPCSSTCKSVKHRL